MAPVNEMTSVCLHCWHSDNDTSKDTRWYCCFCPEECFLTGMEVRHCKGCHMRCIPNPWGFCLLCSEVISNWLAHQKPDADDHYLNECLREYCADLEREIALINGEGRMLGRRLRRIGGSNEHHHRIKRQRAMGRRSN